MPPKWSLQTFGSEVIAKNCLFNFRRFLLQSRLFMLQIETKLKWKCNKIGFVLKWQWHAIKPWTWGQMIPTLSHWRVLRIFVRKEASEPETSKPVQLAWKVQCNKKKAVEWNWSLIQLVDKILVIINLSTSFPSSEAVMWGWMTASHLNQRHNRRIKTERVT